ncbi:aminotransferase class III-fold pyridoxal phosphate-dependent enzyme [Pseudomonas asplenii]|uniref:aminotransferase class III-fold pyridoxal phosphate-dependent enzyme n=1 Tax=Pseudomonas asplenii TaxID=53407 RepID=UPI0006B4CEBA|nr:aminotransferase class III-fold pyridoxal phosphate-dependent enzyme [Pseudomonas fuscovaginae]KPA95038.1 adenosylmethionine-8-amino-7-oxononanoate aminotransferase [Pseudomonas fuscovaginae]
MHLIKPNLRQYYPMAFSAQGSTIMTDDNRTILDGCSGAIACSLGHGHPYIIDRMRMQAHRLSAAYRTQSLNLPAERLAQRLCSKLGQAGAFFVNSGSEAVEAACRTAIQYWDEVGRSKKRHILSRTISYHGSTQASLSLSGHWPRRCSTDSSPIIGQIRGAGMLWGVEIVQDKPRKTPFVPGAQAAESLVRLTWAKGLNLYPASGFAAHRHGDAVIFAPPLNTPMPMLEEMLLLLEQILQSAPGHLHKEADHA